MQYTTEDICETLGCKDYEIENLFRANRLTFVRKDVVRKSRIRLYTKKQFEEIKRELRRY